MKKCKWSETNCPDGRVNYPGKSILSPYCRYHLAISFVYSQRKDKAELNKVRKTLKKGTTRKRFYQSAAWRNFSQYVLLYYADNNLMVRCSTNPNLEYKINDKRICVGHYIKVFDANSSNYSTAFDFRNVAPQSVQENLNGGNMEMMAKFIDKIHGHGTAELLRAKKNEPFKLDDFTFNEISKKYLKLKNELLTMKGISNPWK